MWVVSYVCKNNQVMLQNATSEKVPFFKPGETEKLRSEKIIYSPAVNIEETDEHYLLSVAVPGLKREYFEIVIKDKIITISAKYKSGNANSVRNRCEYDFTNWSRSFILPVDADIILAKAAYRNGELRIRIPKGTEDPAAENPLVDCVY